MKPKFAHALRELVCFTFSYEILLGKNQAEIFDCFFFHSYRECKLTLLAGEVTPQPRLIIDKLSLTDARRSIYSLTHCKLYSANGRDYWLLSSQGLLTFIMNVRVSLLQPNSCPPRLKLQSSENVK